MILRLMFSLFESATPSVGQVEDNVGDDIHEVLHGLRRILRGHRFGHSLQGTPWKQPGKGGTAPEPEGKQGVTRD
jgi:hypothetical protein